MDPILDCNKEFSVFESTFPHKISWIHVSDLKALWNLTGLKMGQCPFCDCDSIADRTMPNGASMYRTWSIDYQS